MTATLNACTVTAGVTWSYSTALSGSITPTVSSSFSYSKALTNGTGAAGTADLIYAVQTTIAASGTTTLDLAGALADWFGTTITMARVKFMYINLTDDTTASDVSIGNATNPLGNWISDATTTVKIRNGGIFLIGDGGATAYAVTGGSADEIDITNNDGSNTATLKIAIVGSSA